MSSMESLQGAHSVQVVMMDKTGTLTSGTPAVTDVIAAGVGVDSLLATSSVHPFEPGDAHRRPGAEPVHLRIA